MSPSPQTPPLSQSSPSSVPSSPTLISPSLLPSSQQPPDSATHEQPSSRASLLTMMPLPRNNSAPWFNASKPKSIGRFFDDLELAFERAGITDDALRKQLTFHYVPIEVEDLWRVLPEASVASQASFDEFKTAVIALYPEYTFRQQFSLTDLKRVVHEWQGRDIDNPDDYGRFYRSFFAIAGVLRQKGWFLPGQEGRLFYAALASSKVQQVVHNQLDCLRFESNGDFVLTRERMDEAVLSMFTANAKDYLK
ncbi:hypothetical protein GY45DRAFT_1279899 [Cubamyces sp. BRFM 1775]|nr:hypothetical protein GY45DRAFT_1279899 [Cubamyces sp. BRFM 1775]